VLDMLPHRPSGYGRSWIEHTLPRWGSVRAPGALVVAAQRASALEVSGFACAARGLAGGGDSSTEFDCPCGFSEWLGRQRLERSPGSDGHAAISPGASHKEPSPSVRRPRAGDSAVEQPQRFRCGLLGHQASDQRDRDAREELVSSSRPRADRVAGAAKALELLQRQRSPGGGGKMVAFTALPGPTCAARAHGGILDLSSSQGNLGADHGPRSQASSAGASTGSAAGPSSLFGVNWMGGLRSTEESQVRVEGTPMPYQVGVGSARCAVTVKHGAVIERCGYRSRPPW